MKYEKKMYLSEDDDADEYIERCINELEEARGEITCYYELEDIAIQIESIKRELKEKLDELDQKIINEGVI